jgi:hypothetical protein
MVVLISKNCFHPVCCVPIYFSRTFNIQSNKRSRAQVAHARNPSYSEGRDLRIVIQSQPEANQETLSQKTHHEKGLVG